MANGNSPRDVHHAIGGAEVEFPFSPGTEKGGDDVSNSFARWRRYVGADPDQSVDRPLRRERSGPIGITGFRFGRGEFGRQYRARRNDRKSGAGRDPGLFPRRSEEKIGVFENRLVARSSSPRRDGIRSE